MSKLYEANKNEKNNLSDKIQNSSGILLETPGLDTKIDKTKAINDNSMFSDIKQVLKAVEFSKSQIELSLADLIREREKKSFYLLNSNLDEKLVFIF